MPKSEKGRQAHGEVPGSATERIAWLLKQRWNSNQSAMASAIGCSQSVLSRIIAGKQKPGRELLERVAAVPSVNPAWLLSGEGEPLLAESDADSLPMSRVLLPGDPALHRNRLLQKRYPVPRTYHSSSRYWLYVHDGFPVVHYKPAKLAAGDLILMETDLAVFVRTLWQPRTFAVVRLAENDYRLCEIAVEGDVNQESTALLANTFEQGDDSRNIVRTIVDRYPNGTSRSRTAPMVEETDDRGRRTLRYRSLNKRPKSQRKIQWDDVVSVGVLLLRDFDNF